MFVNKRVYVMEIELARLRAENEGLRLQEVNYKKQITEYEEKEKERKKEETKISNQFDNLFSYNGQAQGERQ